MTCPPIVGVDCETYRITPGTLAPKLVCLTTSEDGGQLVPWQEAVAEFRGLLASGVRLVAHNAAYDLAVLIRAGVPAIEVWDALMAGRIRDTMVREKLIAIAHGKGDDEEAPRFGFSLADLVSKYLSRTRTGKEGEDAWRLNYHKLYDVPTDQWPAEAVAYAVDDATDAREVYLAQAGNWPANADGDIPDEVPQVQAAFALHLMSCWGLRTDAVRAKTFEANVRKAVDEANKLALEAGFLRYNGTKDMTVLKDLITKAYNGNPPLTVPKGNISTSRETLSESGHPILEAFAELGPYQKLLSTYVPQILDSEVPINPSYNVLVNTGRTSCARPNVQNPPRAGGFRECFIPRNGYVYASVDYDAAELRALAQIWYWRYGSSAMRDAFLRGEDPHTTVAVALFNTRNDGCGITLTYKDAVAIKKDKKDDLYETLYGAQGLRQYAKIINFGIPGGLGALTTVKFAKGYGVHMTEQEARDLKADAMVLWPELAEYFREAANETRRGDVQVRAWVSDRVRGSVGYTQWCNGQFQSLIADAAKAALVEVSRRCYTVQNSPLYGSRPVLFIHDEIIIEAPVDRATAAADELARVMCAVAQKYMPDVPVTATPALWARWLKGRDSKRLPDGTLEVCDG